MDCGGYKVEKYRVHVYKRLDGTSHFEYLKSKDFVQRDVDFDTDLEMFGTYSSASTHTHRRLSGHGTTIHGVHTAHIGTHAHGSDPHSAAAASLGHAHTTTGPNPHSHGVGSPTATAVGSTAHSHGTAAPHVHGPIASSSASSGWGTTPTSVAASSHGAHPHSVGSATSTSHGHVHATTTTVAASGTNMYRFTVTAINFLGEGPHSAQKDINTAGVVSFIAKNNVLIDLFSGPDNVKVTQITDTTIGVRWSTSSSKFMNTEFYNVYYKPQEEDVSDEELMLFERVSAPNNEVVLAGLLPDTTYEIFVTAQDGDFVSKPSDKLYQATGVIMDSDVEVPEVLKNLLPFDIAHDSFVLAWDHPQAIVTDFVVTYKNMRTNETVSKEVETN